MVVDITNNKQKTKYPKRQLLCFFKILGTSETIKVEIPRCEINKIIDWRFNMYKKVPKSFLEKVYVKYVIKVKPKILERILIINSLELE